MSENETLNESVVTAENEQEFVQTEAEVPSTEDAQEFAVEEVETAEAVATDDIPAVEETVEETAEFVDKKEDKEDDDDAESDDKDEDDAEDSEDDEKKPKNEHSLEEFEALQAEINSLRAENEELRNFKLKIENQQKDALIASYHMLSDEDKAEVIAHKTEYSLDEIKAKLAVIYVEKNVNFDMIDGQEEAEQAAPAMTFSLDEEASEGVPAFIEALRHTTK